MAEAPELVKELLWYKGTVSFIWIAIFGTAVLITLRYEKRIWNAALKFDKDNSCWSDRYDTFGPRTVFSGIYSLLNIILCIPFFAYGSRFLKILIAPRLYIMEYLTQLIK